MRDNSHAFAYGLMIFLAEAGQRRYMCCEAEGFLQEQWQR
jgi:hypothetical protein